MKNIQLTYKLKLILVILSGIIFSYLVFTRKVKYTIERVQKIKLLNESTEIDEAIINSNIISLTNQEKEISNALSKDKTTNFESFLIDKITKYNSDITITNISNIYNYIDGDYSVSSLNFTLKNDFKTILKLINYIENELNNINIISVNYFSEKIKFNSSKKHLYATIYIQNIKNS